MGINIKLTAIEKERIRKNKLNQIENEKLDLYGLEKTSEENKILERALAELAMNNKTDIVCPRCGHKLILLTNGASYEIKCLNPEICIKIISRGI